MAMPGVPNGAQQELAAARSPLRGNHHLLRVDYYGNFPNSIKQHGSQQYSKSGCDGALRGPRAVRGEVYNARNFHLQYIFTFMYPL